MQEKRLYLNDYGEIRKKMGNKEQKQVNYHKITEKLSKYPTNRVQKRVNIRKTTQNTQKPRIFGDFSLFYSDFTM